MVLLFVVEFDLVIVSGDVVVVGVVEDVVEGVCVRNVFGGFVDDDGEFVFVVDFVGGEVCGNEDWVVGVLECVDVFDEEDGVFGDFGVGFGGVLVVVEFDVEDLGGGYWRKEFGDLGGFGSDLVGIVDVIGDMEGGVVGLFGGVMGGVGGVLVMDEFYVGIWWLDF